jgi:hypothetical protein
MVQEQEKSSIKQLESILQFEGSQAKLVGNGEEITIPDSVYQVLRQAVHAMALGKAISISSSRKGIDDTASS